MEHVLAALISQRNLPLQGERFHHEGSAILAWQQDKMTYLIATRHQALKLRAFDHSWVYLPATGAVEPVSVTAISQKADVALLSFETTENLETIEPAARSSYWDIPLNLAVETYGFPYTVEPSRFSSSIADVIAALKLRKNSALITGVTFSLEDGLRLVLDQPLYNGESGGLAFSQELGPVAVNQGARLLGEIHHGYVTPLWEIASLLP